MRTIAHLSDLHFGTHTTRVVDDLVASLAQHDVDLVVISGDLTQRARRQEFQEAQQFLGRIPQRKIVVPGNHDVPLFNVFARFVTPFARYEKYLPPISGAQNFYQDEEIAVFGINTARRLTRKNGRISMDQINQVVAAFKSLPGHVLKVLVTHHPLDVPAGEPRLVLAGRWQLAADALAHAGVHLLLSGHYHRATMGPTTAVADRGSILSVHAGTALSTRVRGDGNTYNVIRLERDRVTIQVLAWEQSAGFEHRRTIHYVTEGQTWQRKDL